MEPPTPPAGPEPALAPPPPPPPPPPVPPVLPTQRASDARWPVNLMRVSTVLAWTAVVAIAAGVTLFLIPVKNEYHGRTVQDCGAPAAYLKDGRSSELVSTANPPTWIRKADAAGLNRHQCSVQVADRAVPGAGLLTGGFVGGVAAFLLAWIGHRADRRDERQTVTATA